MAMKGCLRFSLDSGPVAYGLDTGVWTSPLITHVIAEEFGVSYHPGHVRKLLYTMGFSVQRPQRLLVTPTETRASGRPK